MNLSSLLSIRYHRRRVTETAEDYAGHNEAIITVHLLISKVWSLLSYFVHRSCWETLNDYIVDVKSLQLSLQGLRTNLENKDPTFGDRRDAVMLASSWPDNDKKWDISSYSWGSPLIWTHYYHNKRPRDISVFFLNKEQRWTVDKGACR